ncbi:MAG: PLP-dependent aminotransferase family protein [Gammaproteobacteria bacterium]|nr:PLP-dependent aminotransferase family protein [Gammaproteobacteria bacterium]
MQDLLFHLAREGDLTLQVQLREALVRAILDGHVLPSQALPSGRQLAKQLGIARNTVVSVYQRLVDEGYLLARPRSGYYINRDILKARARSTSRPRTRAMFGPHWESRYQSRPSEQRNIQKPSQWQAYRYPFVYGQIDQALFPVTEWRECSRQATSAAAILSWANDSVDTDDPVLVEQIRTRVLPRRGIWAEPEEILITMGAQHALYLAAELLVGPDSVVGMENPGYPDVRNLLSRRSAHVASVAVDEDGLAPDRLPTDVDYVYLTPSHQYPTTVTMSVQRRNQLLSRASADDFVIFEDDYESEFNYVGEPTPALKSLDTNERVLYFGSLSKTLAPGLRLGFFVGPREVVAQARALRRLMLRHPPANNQRAVALFLSQGHHEMHVRRLSQAFQERWHCMRDALDTFLPGASSAPTFGGTSFWVRGPSGTDATELAGRLRDEGVLIEPGAINFAQSPAPEQYFRLGFSSISTALIRDGVARIANALDDATGAA